MHFFLMSLGVLFSVFSIFSFALGWEMWRDSIKKGSFIGTVETKRPDLKLSIDANLKLTELDGRIVEEQIASIGSPFIFSKITPGQYLLKIDGPFLICPQKIINVFPSRDSDIGIISCPVNENDNWEKTFVTRNTITSGSLFTRDGSIFVTGSKEIEMQGRSYTLYKLYDGTTEWTELVVPEINGARSGSFLYQFSTGEIGLGTSGKGAVLSIDNGLSWKKLKSLSDEYKVSYIGELPNTKWIIIANRYVDWGKIPKDTPQCMILMSSNRGESWDVLSEFDQDVVTFIRHSSGRLIIGTTANRRGGVGGFFYSEDGGSTWIASEVDNKLILRGIGSLIELNNGDLLAGTTGWKYTRTYNGETYKAYKGEGFDQGGIILKSENGGKNWELFAKDDSWGDINSILQLNESTYIATERQNLIWSTDAGLSWFHFGNISGARVNSLKKFGNKIVLHETSYVFQSPIDKLITSYIKTGN